MKNALEQTRKAKFTKASHQKIKFSTKELRVITHKEIYEVERYVNPETNKLGYEVEGSRKLLESKDFVDIYDLIEINIDKVSKLRKSKTPCFILKVGNKIFFTKVPFDFKLSSEAIGCQHQCAPHTSVCDRLSPALDEFGGCAKVRNHATFLEMYPFIKVGCETFGTKERSLIVLKCEHFKEPLPPKKMSPDQRLIALADLYDSLRLF